MARKRRAEQPLVRRPALADPKNPSKPQAVAVENTTKTALRNTLASRTHHRHWNRKPRATLSDVAAWLLFFLLTTAGLLAFCILATIVWPS